LCRDYWYPLYAYIRRSGRAPEDAQDLAQGFFERFLEKDYLKTVAPAKGKFRSFLLIALKRYIFNEARRQRAQKRGNGTAHLSLDMEDSERRFAVEPTSNLSPEELYERRWALNLLERVVGRIRAEWEERGAGEVFQLFKPCLTTPPDEVSISEISAAAGMSAGNARVTAHRLRKRYGDVLREEIAHTLKASDNIEEEMQYLRRILSRPGE